MKDCVVAGASFSGLACATALARAGLEVTVLEKKADAGAQLLLAHAVVGLDHDLERLAVRGRGGEAHDRVLRAVGGGEVGAARQVVLRDVDLVAGERLREVGHSLARIVGVAARREARDELLERLERLACGLGVAVGEVLAHEPQPREGTQVLLEVHQPLQVHRVVEVGVVGVQLHELVERRERLRRLAQLVVRVRDLDLRLLREAPVRELGFELLVQLDGRFTVVVVELFLGGLVELSGGPVLLRIGLVLQPAARAERGGEEEGGQCRYTASHMSIQIALHEA